MALGIVINQSINTIITKMYTVHSTIKSQVYNNTNATFLKPILEFENNKWNIMIYIKDLNIIYRR